MNTFDGNDRRRGLVSVDDVEIRSTVTVFDREEVLLFDVDHLGAWIRSTVVLDLPRYR